MSRPLPRAGLLATLAVGAAVASATAAKPSFETGPYLGNVAVGGKPPVEFTATRKRVKGLDIGSMRATCSDGRSGTLNLPDMPSSLKIRRGRFSHTVKPSDTEHAGTRLTGRLKGRRASGTVRVVLRPSPEPGAVKCDTGKRKWRAKLDELLIRLP